MAISMCVSVFVCVSRTTGQELRRDGGCGEASSGLTEAQKRYGRIRKAFCWRLCVDGMVIDGSASVGYVEAEVGVVTGRLAAARTRSAAKRWWVEWEAGVGVGVGVGAGAGGAHFGSNAELPRAQRLALKDLKC